MSLIVNDINFFILLFYVLKAISGYPSQKEIFNVVYYKYTIPGIHDTYIRPNIVGKLEISTKITFPILQ